LKLIHERIHAITVPLHDPLKVGTLNNTVKDLAAKTGRDWMAIMEEL